MFKQEKIFEQFLEIFVEIKESSLFQCICILFRVHVSVGCNPTVRAHPPPTPPPLWGGGKGAGHINQTANLPLPA